MKKICAISDTHGFHERVKIEDDVDIIIHTGDATNARDPYQNEIEMHEFLHWYGNRDVKYKIYVPGNHDTSLEKKLFTRKDFEERGIIYLEHEAVEIEGIKIFGSPFTPSFGYGWAYNVDRAKIYKKWEDIPSDIDILATHGPPQTILDITTDREGYIRYCGDRSLLRYVRAIQPTYHIFGHIHNYKEHINHGTRTIYGCVTTFVNATMVEDGRFDKGIVNYPIELEIEQNS